MGRLLDEDDVIDAVQQHREGVLGGYEYDEGVAFVYAAAHNHIIEVIKQLPSAQPERERGHWILIGENKYTCSECGKTIITNKDYIKEHKWCFGCGADMRGEQDG